MQDFSEPNAIESVMGKAPVLFVKGSVPPKSALAERQTATGLRVQGKGGKSLLFRYLCCRQVLLWFRCWCCYGVAVVEAST